MPCAADDDGRDCYRETVMTAPVPLCALHRAEVALAIVPDLLRNQLSGVERLVAAAPPPNSELVSTARPVPVEDLLNGAHLSIVYFVTNGGRVKIGYTTNLKSRLGALTLRPDSVLLTVDGGPDTERALHAHFAACRVGDTEWFELSPEIFRYITNRQIAPTAQASTRRATARAKTSEIPSILVDVLEVVPADEARVWNQRIAERLGRLRPDAYEEWKGETVTLALKAQGVETRPTAGYTEDGKRATRRGVGRADVVTAAAKARRRAVTFKPDSSAKAS